MRIEKYYLLFSNLEESEFKAVEKKIIGKVEFLAKSQSLKILVSYKTISTVKKQLNLITKEFPCVKLELYCNLVTTLVSSGLELPKYITSIIYEFSCGVHFHYKILQEAESFYKDNRKIFSLVGTPRYRTRKLQN